MVEDGEVGHIASAFSAAEPLPGLRAGRWGEAARPGRFPTIDR